MTAATTAAKVNPAPAIAALPHRRYEESGALDLKAPERVTSRAPTPKPLPLGYGEAMLTIGPGRIRASFHQSRSFRITDATRLCGALWIAEAQGTRRKGYGLIEPDDGTKDVFVFITSISDASLDDFREDRRVGFNERISQRNGRPEAFDVVVLTLEQSQPSGRPARAELAGHDHET